MQSNLCNLRLWCKLQEFLFHISCYQNLRYQFDTKLHLVWDDQWKPHQNQLNMNLFLKWLNYKFRIRIGTKGGPGEYSLQNQETPLIKNLQFLTNFDETLPKCSPHESIILTKFRKNWTKIEDFLLIAQLVQNHLFILDCL